jgi:hypothetical protein
VTFASTNPQRAAEFEAEWSRARPMRRIRRPLAARRNPRSGQLRRAAIETRSSTYAQRQAKAERGLAEADPIGWARRKHAATMDAVAYAKARRAKHIMRAIEAKYDRAALEQLGEEGKAYMYNGRWRFPIADREDLKNAIATLGEAPLPLRPSIKAYITKRAVEMFARNLLPDHWSDK